MSQIELELRPAVVLVLTQVWFWFCGDELLRGTVQTQPRLGDEMHFINDVCWGCFYKTFLIRVSGSVGVQVWF